MKIAIVLGNRLNDDGSLTDIGKQRLELLKKAELENDFYKIILSGGMPNKKAGKSEAEAMFEQLQGENASICMKCVLEDKSRTTFANARFALPMAVEMGADEVTVITTNEHLDRKYFSAIKVFTRSAKAFAPLKLSFWREK